VSVNDEKAIQKPKGRVAIEAGAGSAEITPRNSQFLYGYPFVRRYSTGVHDPLLSSALYLSDGQTKLLFVANDIIYISKESVARVRERISNLTSVPTSHIMVTASHTHSGPMTQDFLITEGDPVIPKTDPDYVRFMEDQIVSAASDAVRRARPAEIGLGVADGTGVGTNRRDPKGPSNPEVPVLIVRSLSDHTYLACMVVCSMHPTVLHEDSTLVSADFPGMARQYLQHQVLGRDCPILCHLGPAGNQSPRHSVSANTFPEAERLGHLLGKSIAAVVPQIHYRDSVSLACTRDFVELPRRSFPTVEHATAALASAEARLKELRSSGAPREQIRTAEVDWFGAGETVTLARAAADQRLDRVAESCLPAEIQIMEIGPWAFVGWQGEIFVEYGLAVKARAKDTHVISLANGELQGYIVTEEAIAEGAYEAGNALFAAASGTILVDRTLKMLSASGHTASGDEPSRLGARA
jgi:hypothetical protein